MNETAYRIWKCRSCDLFNPITTVECLRQGCKGSVTDEPTWYSGNFIQDFTTLDVRGPTGIVLTQDHFHTTETMKESIKESLKTPNEVASTGAVREKLYERGKKFPMRMDLMMRNTDAVRALAEVFGEGFEKYGADNWMKGFPESVLMNHIHEHLNCHNDKDPKDDHLAHALWNLWTLIWVRENKPELMDLTGPNGLGTPTL